MFVIVTDKGITLNEREQFWTDVPPDVRIRELHFTPARGQSGKLEGFDAYGFQRYQLSLVNGARVGGGVQLLGVKGETVTIVDINNETGARAVSELPLSELTYSRELLRHGG